MAGEPLPLPPSELRFMGEDDQRFLAIGDRIVLELQEHAGLSPAGRLLDIGSGYGRLAHALLRTGWWEGEYLGIDLSRRHINWCNEHLSTPTVRFEYRDIASDRYNPDGTLAPADLTVSMDNVDVIALISVFTHMWPDDIEAYLRLAAELLAPDGRVFSTFFLFDIRWRARDLLGRSNRSLPHRHSRWCRYMRSDDPLHLIAYRRRWVERASRRAGLEVEEVYQRGSSEESQHAVIIRRR